MNLQQGDQMSWRKTRPKCNPRHFLLQLIHHFYRGKSSPKFVRSVIFKLTALINYCPIGENSPNLVTQIFNFNASAVVGYSGFSKLNKIF
jgi:hypothetical protein